MEEDRYEQEQGKEITDAAINQINTAAKLATEKTPDAPVGEGNIDDKFAGLPIESLIAGPIIAAAKAQQELVALYVDGIKKLAYSEGDPAKGVNKLDISFDRPVRQQDQGISMQNMTISAPLLSLVPVPALLVDSVNVDFNMEVKEATLDKSENHAEAEAQVKYHSWFGLDAQISGKVSSTSSHQRESDSSAKYHITVQASQQPPAEGMAKLTALLADSMEPIESNKP